MAEALQVLILEDNPADAELVQFELQDVGLSFTPKVVKTKKDFVHALQEFPPDLILSDYDLPTYNGALALAEARRRCPNTPFILVSGAVSEDRAIEILTQGAKDYVLKTRLQQRLVPAVRRALAEAEEHRARKQAEEELREAHKTLEKRVEIRTAELQAEIVARKKVEEALRESEKRLNNLYQQSPIATFTWQKSGDDFILVDFNRAAIQITDEKVSKFLGRSAVELYRDRSQILTDMNLCYNEQSVVSREIVSLDFARGRLLSVHYGFIPPDLIIVHAEDITDRRQAEVKLKESENRYRELSIIDDLTQLYNSRHFYVKLKSEIDRVNRYEQFLTLLLLDLDDFKEFNDAYGHVEGDQVLLRLGQVVKRCLRQIDSAYRYGGEEFTILLPMTTCADGAVTAERIRTEFKKETFSPMLGQDVHVTLSIGLAQYKTQEDMKAFVRRVDQLMYKAKKNGKDRVYSGP